MGTIIRCRHCTTQLRYQTPFDLCFTCQKAQLLYGDDIGKPLPPDEGRKMTAADIQKLWADQLEHLNYKLNPDGSKTHRRMLKKAISSTEDIREYFLPAEDVTRAARGVEIPEPCPNPLEHIFEEPEEEEPRMRLWKVRIWNDDVNMRPTSETLILAADENLATLHALMDLGYDDRERKTTVKEVEGPFVNGHVLAFQVLP